MNTKSAALECGQTVWTIAPSILLIGAVKMVVNMAWLRVFACVIIFDNIPGMYCIKGRIRKSYDHVYRK